MTSGVILRHPDDDCCPYCGSQLQHIPSTRVYRSDFGWLHACSRYPDCDAYVGCHRDSKRPKGTVAQPRTRLWRKAAHAAFDPIWKGRSRTQPRNVARRAAYTWLRAELGMSPPECHIGRFEVSSCQRAIRACWPRIGSVPRRHVRAVLGDEFLASRLLGGPIDG